MRIASDERTCTIPQNLRAMLSFGLIQPAGRLVSQGLVSYPKSYETPGALCRRTPVGSICPSLPSHTPGGYIGTVVSDMVRPGRCPAPRPYSRQSQRPLMLRQGMDTDVFESGKRTELPLASSAGGCGCCSSEPSSSHVGTGDVEFAVEGLTCGHCVQTVEKAVSALEGVESASIEFVPGGGSRLIVGGQANSVAVREAVTSAGYSVISN
jgi:copper chaperone